MRRVIAHAGQALDDHGHPRQRPEGRVKSVGLRALPEGRLDVAQLVGLDLRLPSSAARAAQRLRAAAAPGPVPAHDTLAADAQPSRDRPLGLLRSGEEARRLPPPKFQPVEIPSRRNASAHASSYFFTSTPVTLLCRIQ
jgi:hypothetical protein